MLKQTALLVTFAGISLAAAASGASAGPDGMRIVRSSESAGSVHLIRNDRQRASRSLKLSATQSSGPCGVWRCTWRTSDGGCLVWEKTKCKVINPFD